jgi:hypothetical protein
MRFHLSPSLFNLHDVKRLFIRQLAVFELFSMWVATTAFMFIIYLGSDDGWYNYVAPTVESLAVFSQILALVPINFSAPQKFGPARYAWYFSVMSMVWTSLLSLIYDSLSVALKVYDPVFFSSKGIHALVLVLGTMVVSYRLSVFAIARRKMWNPKANGIQPNLKSVHGHFADCVNMGDGAFLYSSMETIPLHNVTALPISAISSKPANYAHYLSSRERDNNSTHVADGGRSSMSSRVPSPTMSQNRYVRESSPLLPHGHARPIPVIPNHPVSYQLTNLAESSEDHDLELHRD